MARSIETSIEIAAAPAAVWAELVDFARYPEWNPFIVSLEGRAAQGERLKAVLRPGPGRTMVFRPSVVACQPERVFAWRGRLVLPGLFDGEHRFELVEAGADRTRLLHGERFTGVLVPLIWRMVETDTRRGFEAMNAALKARAEARR